MRILKFNESVKELMTGKSKEDVKSALLKLTPYGMLNKIYTSEDQGVMDFNEFEEIARERIEESFGKLDTIFEKYEDKDLKKLIGDVTQWVKKNGGNDVNVTDYGFISLADQIVSNGFQDRHDSVVIYDKEVFDSFKELLKNFAICETQNNNRDYDY